VSLTFDSPRFSLRDADLGAIEAALAEIGHVVLDDLWSTPFLAALRDLAEARFRAGDERYLGRLEGLPDSVIETYLGGVANLGDLAPDYPLWDARFFSEVERSGLPVLYRRLFYGDFVVSANERVFRRLDPKFPIRFAGLHCDGQLAPLSREARIPRELTLWTPLQPCLDESIGRLLLLHRDEDWQGFLAEGPQIDLAGVPFGAIQLRPHQFRDEAAASALLDEMHAQYGRLFATRRCYAPHVPLGSAILFDKDVPHGSYHRQGMAKPRYSMDFRAVAEYRSTPETHAAPGRLFSMVALPREKAPHSLQSTLRRLGLSFADMRRRRSS